MYIFVFKKKVFWFIIIRYTIAQFQGVKFLFFPIFSMFWSHSYFLLSFYENLPFFLFFLGHGVQRMKIFMPVSEKI